MTALVGSLSPVDAQGVQDSESRYVQGWTFRQSGKFDAAFEAYEAAFQAAVLPNQRKKILRAIGEVGERNGAPASQRNRAYFAFEQAALLGDGFSTGRLVELQEKNLYRPRNLRALIPFYERRAHEGGSATTALLLAKFSERGEVGPVDHEAALGWYEVAVRNGSGQAGLELAIHYAGQGNDKEALRWLKEARTELPEAQSRVRLARAFLTGEDAPRNISIARRWAMSVVPLDAGMASLLLRQILEQEFDIETFTSLLQVNVKATGEQRTTLAMVRKILDGLSVDTLAAVKDVSLRLSKENNQFAAVAAAAMIFQKNGFDDATANMLLLGALRAGEPEAVSLALDSLASAQDGSKRRQDMLDAITTAAQKGAPTAMVALGDIYSVGGFVRQDAIESFKWKLRAAQAGNATAAFQTGMAHLSGNGVAEDKAQARRWLDKAKASGNGMAASILLQMAATRPSKQ